MKNDFSEEDKRGHSQDKGNAFPRYDRCKYAKLEHPTHIRNSALRSFEIFDRSRRRSNPLRNKNRT